MSDLEIRAFGRRFLVVYEKSKKDTTMVHNTGGDFDPINGDFFSDETMVFGLGGSNGGTRRVPKAE